jgi:L-ribulokinase
MARLHADSFSPIAQNQATYDQLYREYVTLHDYFGRGANDVMKRVKHLREEILTR